MLKQIYTLTNNRKSIEDIKPLPLFLEELLKTNEQTKKLELITNDDNDKCIQIATIPKISMIPSMATFPYSPSFLSYKFTSRNFAFSMFQLDVIKLQKNRCPRKMKLLRINPLSKNCFKSTKSVRHQIIMDHLSTTFSEMSCDLSQGTELIDHNYMQTTDKHLGSKENRINTAPKELIHQYQLPVDFFNELNLEKSNEDVEIEQCDLILDFNSLAIEPSHQKNEPNHHNYTAKSTVRSYSSAFLKPSTCKIYEIETPLKKKPKL